MRIITIGSDRTLFAKGSAARTRAAAYAERFGELHIVVFSLRSLGNKEVHDGPLSIYPTNSLFRLLYPLDAARIAARLPADVITAQDPFESGLAALLARRSRPLHMQLHTDIVSPFFGRSYANKVRLFIAGFVLPRAKRIRTVSRNIKEGLLRRYRLSAPVSVLPIFVDAARFASAPRSKHPRFKKTLLWVGRFEEEKNPTLAVEALAAARKAGEDAGLVMLGSGSLEPGLRALGRRLGVGDFMEFPGYRDPAPYYAMADAVLFTSNFDGYGMVIIEALAAGVPVLSTDVGAAREAGAIITSHGEFVSSLVALLKAGPGRGVLINYPYKNREEYESLYCKDITSTV